MTDQPPSRKKKHSLLLVDDEPEILYSLKGLLRRDFDLHVAESGRRALEILAEHPIHVVMTDQRMPEMSGVELMGRVRTEHPEAIRIVFTGYADIKAVVEAINSGGLYRYITKPWDPDDLIETLHQAAAAYDQMVERRRLLGDLRRHVQRGQEFADRLATGQTAEAAELDDYRESTAALLSRIDKLHEALKSATPPPPGD
ncbi:MAG: response regulator [Planctomycetes bacterium]|nr:response regulator [Planctomycetota bacterium]